MPSYSVVIPARNAARFLPDALDSVAAQSAAPERIVVIDDGSVDDTAAIAAARNATVLSWRESQGPAAARNAGVAACTSDIVAFLDADDLWTPEHARLSLAALDRSDVVFSAGSAEHFGDDSGPVPMQFEATEPLDLHDALIVENPVIQSGVMVRTDVFRAVGGYDESLRWSEDYDLWVRIAPRGLFAPLPTRTVRRRVHGEQATNLHLYDMLKSSWFVRRRLCEARLRTATGIERQQIAERLLVAARRDIDWAVWTGERKVLDMVRVTLSETDSQLGLNGSLAEVGGTRDTVLRLAQDVRCRASRVRARLRRTLESRSL